MTRGHFTQKVPKNSITPEQKYHWKTLFCYYCTELATGAQVVFNEADKPVHGVALSQSLSLVLVFKFINQYNTTSRAARDLKARYLNHTLLKTLV